MRRFEFLLDPEIPPGDKFGGSKLSELIDAGQYLAVADRAARLVPGGAEALGHEARREARWWMNRAVNALEEVLKFIPAAEDQVPQTALFTADGKAVYAREPGRFRRSRLNAVLGVYREMLARLDASSSQGSGE
jgi:glutathione S-transferase